MQDQRMMLLPMAFNKHSAHIVHSYFRSDDNALEYECKVFPRGKSVDVKRVKTALTEFMISETIHFVSV